MIDISDSTRDFIRDKINTLNEGRPDNFKIRIEFNRGYGLKKEQFFKAYFPVLEEIDRCNEDSVYKCIGVSKSKLLSINRKLLEEGFDLEMYYSRDSKQVIFYTGESSFDSYVDYLSTLRGIEEINQDKMNALFNTGLIKKGELWSLGNYYVMFFHHVRNSDIYLRIEESPNFKNLAFYRYPGDISNVIKALKKLGFSK